MNNISMSNISPKLIDVENNRVGDYNENRKNHINSPTDGSFLANNKRIYANKNGRFPTQLFCNIKNEQYKYVKYIT
jgi:hypothetical protein